MIDPDFINLVGLDKLCRNEQEWGGLGFIITGRDVRKDDKSPAQESYTVHGSDYIVVTPCYKELSWLFRNTYQYVEKGTITGGNFTNTFWAACTGFFLLHKTYKAKSLLFFVLNFLISVEKGERNSESDEE